MWNKLFWKDVGERVLATVAQVVIAVFAADGFNLLSADFTGIAVAAVTAALLVVLKAVVAVTARPNTPTVSPASFIKDERGFTNEVS